MLVARHVRGGKLVVLMQPSLPIRWFDLCLIPEHDEPPNNNRIIVTKGALNTVVPTADHQAGAGLILVGGPSRHYYWDHDALMEQITTIVSDGELKWYITDSPRTPELTRNRLSMLAAENTTHRPYVDCDADWLPDQLRHAGTVWVTRDSVSMIYEALTAGAAVGVIDVPRKKSSRMTRAIDSLISSEQVTSYAGWQNGACPAPPVTPLNEAARCAQLILERFPLPAK